MGVAATLPELSEWTQLPFFKALITNAAPCGYFIAKSTFAIHHLLKE